MTQVFLSWSGGVSLQVAKALEDCLQSIFSDVSVWMSDSDIEAGTKWEHELVNALRCSRLGVICLTPDNVGSSWLVFEAGALSMMSENARIVPMRFGLQPTDIKFPLAQFNNVGADKDGVRDLVRSINSIRDNPGEKAEIDGLFDEKWSLLENRLRQIPPAKTHERSTHDLIEEVLMLSRKIVNPNEIKLGMQLGGDFGVYRIRKRVYDLVKGDFTHMVLDDLLLARDHINRRLETVTADAEEELLDDLIAMANRELSERTDDEDKIRQMAAPALKEFIAETQSKLLDTATSDQVRETLKAHLTIAKEERNLRKLIRSGPQLR